jgi:hypothetical protein
MYVNSKSPPPPPLRAGVATTSGTTSCHTIPARVQRIFGSSGVPMPVSCDNSLFRIIRVEVYTTRRNCVTCFDCTFAPPSFFTLLQVGSYYAMHFVANMLVAVAAVLYSCESSGFYAMFLFTYLGVSVVGVNILGHRCVSGS